MHETTRNEGNLITVRVSGKLTQADYDDLIPAWQQLLQQEGSMRMLLLMEDFHGWELGAAWDDFRFGTSHAEKMERIAMVGDKSWQHWLARIGGVFLPERIRYFALADRAEAEAWVRAE